MKFPPSRVFPALAIVLLLAAPALADNTDSFDIGGLHAHSEGGPFQGIRNAAFNAILIVAALAFFIFLFRFISDYFKSNSYSYSWREEDSWRMFWNCFFGVTSAIIFFCTLFGLVV